MNQPGPIIFHSPADRWLARFAKLVVAMLFVLILIGGHTTTSGAGMAFPDWPLSNGSLNPAGWLTKFPWLLEHGHRLTAETVALLIGILCAWVWQSPWSIPIAFAVSAALSLAAKFSGAEPSLIAHTGLWSAAITFALILLAKANRMDLLRPPAVRWLAFAAFLGVLVQAVMGGLRVTIEAGGNPAAAMAFRIAHGSFAPLELSLVVALAATLSPAWDELRATVGARSTAVLAWVTASFIFLQLLVGAAMRHFGAGLAIPTWPAASSDGRLLPAVHGTFTDLNFTHTRVGALLVTLLVVALALRALGHAAGQIRLIRPAALLVALVAAQFTLGLYVVWTQKRFPVVTTLHVVTGAALLATTVLLAVRAGRAAQQLRTAAAHAPALPHEYPSEVSA